MIKKTGFILIALILGMTACQESVQAEYDGVEVITTSGENHLKATNRAIRKAVRKGIIALIGRSTYKKEKKTLENTILESRFSKARQYTQSHEILGRSTSEGKAVVTVKVYIHLEKLRKKLKALNIPILKNPSSGSQAESRTLGNVDIIKGESFLVYYDEENLNIPRELAELAVRKINNFLASQGLEYIDLRQIKRLKKDRELIEEEVSGGLSIVQVLAQKLHADVYIVVNGTLDDGFYENGKYQSRGGILLSAFESSTARGLGSEQSSIKLSGKSLDSVQRRIVLDTTTPSTQKLMSSIIQYKASPHIYIVTLLGDVDFDMRKTFKRALNKDSNMVSFKLISTTNRKAKYKIKYRGLTNDLIEGLFKRLREKEGFEDIHIKLVRRKEIILRL